RLEFVQAVDDELRRLAGDPWKAGAVARALRRVAAKAGVSIGGSRFRQALSGEDALSGRRLGGAYQRRALFRIMLGEAEDLRVAKIAGDRLHDRARSRAALEHGQSVAQVFGVLPREARYAIRAALALRSVTRGADHDPDDHGFHGA